MQHRSYRIRLTICLLAVVVLGLMSRQYAFLLPSSWDKYPGDALWAVAVLLAFALVKVEASPWRLGAYALLTSYAVELSQLYQRPWINAIRATTIGHLFLGSTFFAGDLIAYTVGIVVGVPLLLVIRRASPPARPDRHPARGTA